MRTKFEAAQDKRWAIERAEKQGIIADSIEVRKNLLAQVKSGQKTLEQAQKELKQIQKSANKNGKVTRQQVFSKS